MHLFLVASLLLLVRHLLLVAMHLFLIASLLLLVNQSKHAALPNMFLAPRCRLPKLLDWLSSQGSGEHLRNTGANAAAPGWYSLSLSLSLALYVLLQLVRSSMSIPSLLSVLPSRIEFSKKSQVNTNDIEIDIPCSKIKCLSRLDNVLQPPPRTARQAPSSSNRASPAQGAPRRHAFSKST